MLCAQNMGATFFDIAPYQHPRSGRDRHHGSVYLCPGYSIQWQKKTCHPRGTLGLIGLHQCRGLTDRRVNVRGIYAMY